MTELSQIGGIADIPRYQARQRPEDTALIMDERRVSYGALNVHSNRAANGLTAAGVTPGMRVAYLAKNSDRYFEILFGCAKARGVLVGINWRLAGPEIAYILDDARAQVLFVGREFYDLVEGILPDLKHLKTIVALDGGHGQWPAYEAWRDAQAEDDPGLPIDPQEDVVQLYTSGTTGHPKGVRLTNANYIAIWKLGFETKLWEWKPEDVNFVCMPLFHVAGVNVGLFGLLQGCTNVVLRDADPGVILELIERHRINKMFLVPALILFVLNHPRAGETDLSSLDLLFYGASPIAEELLIQAQKAFQCRFVQLYGMTETSGAATFLSPEDHDPARGKLRSCGRAWPGIELKAVDAQGNEVPQGEVGEIVMRGNVLMSGYWNLPDATARTIVDGWLHSGDAGYFDAEGYLYIYDRVKDMIVSGGENIYPAEVENALFAHPAVADVAVIGVPDKDWGEAVKAFVVLAPNETATEEDIIAFARTRIAGFKVPKSIDFVEALPRNASGKILRRELRAPFWEGEERQVH